MRRTPRMHHVFGAVLTAALLLTALPGVAAANEGFGDIEPDAYYTDAVAWMVGENITTGIEAGCFGPSLNVTRGQVAAFLHRLDESVGNDPAAGPHPFADVRSAYQREPVGWLFTEGLTTGVSSTRFAPDYSISRGDFAVLLWRYAGSPSAEAASPFVDVTRSYQRTAIAWMAEQDITTGTSPSRFDPDGSVTRAQVATFIFRYVDPADVPPSAATGTCTRDIRIALEIGGLTASEAMCAAPWLTDFEVEYLIDVVKGRSTASFNLIVSAAAVGSQCLTSNRVAALSSVFF